MALIYDATLRPTKTEMIASWLPGTGWFAGPAQPDVQRVAAFRWDDPAGEVGVETHLVSVDGTVLQVPLTYRAAPLAGADAFLLGTMEHSVLGRRWVYDAVGDPVYAEALAAAVLDGQDQAKQQTPDGDVLPPTVALSGTGYPAGRDLVEGLDDGPDGPASTLTAAGLVFSVLRAPDLDGPAVQAPALTATWAGQQVPVVLAYVSGQQTPAADGSTGDIDAAGPGAGTGTAG